MNIWLICQYFAPEPNAAASRLLGFAKIWTRVGNKVTLLTSIPNHPYGKTYSDYRTKGSFPVEYMDGIEVRRHTFFMTASANFALHLLSQLSFMMVILLKYIFKAPAEKPDVIIISSPTFFPAFAAWLLAKRYKVPFVFEARDLWPGVLVDTGYLKPGFLLNMLQKMEMFLYKRAAAIITATRGFGQEIVGRGVDGTKVYVVTNGVSDDDIQAAHDPLLEPRVDKLRTDLQISPLSKVVLYIGNHDVSQGLGQIIDAARILMARTDFIFLFVGEGNDKERLKRIARGMPNVQFFPDQSRERLWEFYRMAYLSIVPLKDIKGYETFIPAKMFEIMASGTALIGCLTGEAAAILEESRAAVVLPPEEPEKLAQAIIELVDNPEKVARLGQEGKSYILKKYRHGLLATQALGILHKVTGIPVPQQAAAQSATSPAAEPQPTPTHMPPSREG